MRVSTMAPNQTEAAWPVESDPGSEFEEDSQSHEPKPIVHVMPLALSPAPVHAPAPGWHVRLDHLDAEGRVFVSEDPGTGQAHVLVKLFGNGGRRGLQMEADVRESWLAAACNGAGSDEERAWRIVRGITDIAGLPNQHTVRVEALA
jgi:hypothetical protein